MPRTNGTTTEREYGAKHQALRKQWAPKVARGEVDCHATRCLIEEDGGDRRINPWDEWDLGHTPDRARWTGPEHRRCNRSEGATRGNAIRNGKAPDTIAARSWVL